MYSNVRQAEMWRVINFIGRGLRSVRPSQCGPQDSFEEGSSKCHNHYYLYNEVSKAQAATLKHYSTISCWSPLTIKSNDNFLEKTTCSSNQALSLCHSSFCKIGEGIHTESCHNGSKSSEGRDCARYHPKCPPWHWQILEDNQKLDKCCSEEKEKEEKQNTKDWEKTCHSQEWKEILQASPTLHALGWGSAAVLTWSLFHGWSEHRPCPYQKKSEQHQRPHKVSRKHYSNSNDANHYDQENEDTLNHHKPFKDFSFKSNSQESSSESLAGEHYYKNYLGEIYKIPNLQCNLKSTKSHEWQTQEITIPVYSLQQKFLDVARKVFSTQESDYVKDKYNHEEMCKYDEFHDMNKSPLSLRSEGYIVLDKSDSGCISDLHQSFQSQTCGTRPENSQNQFNQNEESNVKTVSDTTRKGSVTEVFKSELSAEKKEDASEHCQPTTQNEPVNNSEDKEMKVLRDRLHEIVEAYHFEQLLRKDGKTLFDTVPEEMVVYFQAGVLLSDITSTFNLALCYHIGHGITQDMEKARKLYEVASAAGHGWATYNLAVMLNQGLGGPSLPSKAHSLLLQAAEMGVKEAKDALLVLEEEKQQQMVSLEDEPHLRQCYSEPCLFSALAMEWPSSYSASDIQSLLDEDNRTVGAFSTVADVS